MYLHLGNDTVIKTENIVGVFDLESASVSRFTKKYFSKVQKENKVINVSPEIPKSFIVCDEDGRETVYISQISVATLLKRMNRADSSFDKERM